MKKLFNKEKILKISRSLKELFIVFLGVLLALVGENYVQSINDRNAEKEYLNGLLVELDNSVGVAIDDRRRIQTLDSSAMKLISMSKKDYAPSQDTCSCNDPCRLINLLNGIIEPDIYKYVYEDLKSTGNLKVISNSKLRQEIILYYERMIYLEKWSRDVRANLFPFYDKKTIDLVTPDEFYGDTSCDEKKVLKLLKQRAMIDHLNSARMMASETGGFLDERIESTQWIINAIKEELSKK